MKKRFNLAANIYASVYLFLLCGFLFAILILNNNYATTIPRPLSFNSLIYVFLSLPYIYLIAKSNSPATNFLSLALIYPLVLTNMVMSIVVLLAVTVAYIKRNSKKAGTVIIHILALLFVLWFCFMAYVLIGDELFNTDYEAVSYSPESDYVIKVKHDSDGGDTYYVAENKKLWILLFDAYPIGKEIEVKDIYKKTEIEWLDNRSFSINGEVVVVE